jgi:hypothetical protein
MSPLTTLADLHRTLVFVGAGITSNALRLGDALDLLPLVRRRIRVAFATGLISDPP